MLRSAIQRTLERIPSFAFSFHRTMTVTTQSHYQGHTVSSYESAFFYSAGAYTDYLSKLVVKRLGLQPTTSRRILDIGGGTGNFTRMIVRNSPEVQAIIVDPFLDGHHDDEQNTAAVRFVKASAESLAEPSDGIWWRQDYHQVLMKEVIHHIDATVRPKIFAGVFRDLPHKESPDPGILIITRPHLEIDYPLWDEARQVWAANQPSQEALRVDLEYAGFSFISSSIEEYPCEVQFERWISMVKNRFWSTFSTFTDEELNTACERMRNEEAHRIDDNGIIRFQDRLLVISAHK